MRSELGADNLLSDTVYSEGQTFKWKLRRYMGSVNKYFHDNDIHLCQIKYTNW